jgi:hypothetical protein
MTANELMDRLQVLVDEHDNREVYFSFDHGILVNVKDVEYVRAAQDSPYYKEKTTLFDIFVINRDE